VQEEVQNYTPAGAGGKGVVLSEQTKTSTAEGAQAGTQGPNSSGTTPNAEVGVPGYPGATTSPGGNLSQESVERITDGEVLEDQFYLDPDDVVSCEIRATNGDFGVADVCLVVAKEGAADRVAESLEQRKDDRIAEFSAYDVYDSAQTALSADVSEMGRLVVLLMLDEEGKASAKEIIESYLPED
jgi:hypothetical protein